MADDDDLPGLDDLITDKGELEVDTSGLPDMPDLGLVESKLVKSFKAAAEKSKINFEGADAIYGDHGSIERAVYDAAKASSLPFYDKDGRTPDRTSMGNTIKSVRDFFAKVRGNPDNYVYLNLPVGDKNFAKNLEKQLRPIFAKENQQLKLDGVALVMGQKPPRVSNVSY